MLAEVAAIMNDSTTINRIDRAEKVFHTVETFLGEDDWLCKDGDYTVDDVFTRDELEMARQLFKTELFIQELQTMVGEHNATKPLPPSLITWFEKVERTLL